MLAGLAAFVLFTGLSSAGITASAQLTTTPNPATGKAPLSVSFDGSGSSSVGGTIDSWTLDFGDADSTSGSGPPPSSGVTHSYAAGSYTATLTVTDTLGDTDTATAGVTSNANVAPTARLTSSPTPATGKAPLSVTFNGSTSSDSDGTIQSWSLDFGDGNSTSGNGTPPSSTVHSYAAGSYTAVLTVTDDNGAQDTASVNVISNAPPTAVLTSSPSPATGKAPLSVTFNGSTSSDSDGTIASWSLAFGDGTSTSGSGIPSSSIVHSYAAGTFTATLTVTDNHGAQDTDTVSVNTAANVAPTAHLTSTPSPAAGTAPLSVTFNGSTSTDSDGTIASWSLSFGDGSANASGGGVPPASIVHSYAAGNRTATLTVTDNNGATDTDTVSVAANAPPTARLTTTPSPATGKAPLSVTFNGSTSSDTDGTIASWSLAFGDGTSTSGSGAPPSSTAVHSYAAGSYTATLTVTDNDGAVSAPKTVTVTSNANVAPTARMTSTPSPATGKAPLNVTFNGSTSSDSDGVISSWTLDFGDGTTAASGLGLPLSVPHTYAAGNWTATLTVTDDNGATGSTTISVTANPNVAPTARLTSSPSPATGTAPLSVTFNGSTSSDSDGTLQSWTLAFGDGTFSSGSGTPSSSVSHTYSPGSYTATLTVTDNNGATGSATVTVSVNAKPTASLTADKTSGPAPLTVTFNGSLSADSDGSIQSWTLDFGDGSTPATGTGTPGSSITHTYSAARPATPYPAKLTVTDNQGATASATVSITVLVNQPPVARLSVSPTSGTTPLDVSFNGSTSSDSDDPIASWTLDFGDGSTPATGTGTPPATIPHTYTTTQASAQVFTAHLSLVDAGGVHSTSDAIVSVTVNPQPSITLNDVTVTEIDVGLKAADFTLSLSAPSTHAISVDYATADGTATSADYNAVQGTLTIPAGTSCPSDPICKITVQVVGDTVYEGTETFTLNLSNPVGATIARGTATGTINDNDPAPILMIKNGGRLEGNAGSVVSGAQNWVAGGSLTVADASGLSTGQPFYISTPGSHRSDPAGPYSFGSKTGNTLNNVTPAGSAPAGRIAFQMNTVSLDVLLCDVSTVGSLPDNCVPTVSGATTTVQFSTQDGGTTVKDGQDYVATCSAVTLSCEGPVSSPITIAPGQSSGTITVPIIGNTTQQISTRSFIVKLLSATNAAIRWGLGTAVIVDDDAANPPTAVTGDVSAFSSNDATVGGTVNAKGAATTAYVEYGKTATYGSQTAGQLLSDSADEPLSFHLGGLAQNTTYHYRVVASHDSDHATGYGLDKTFTTSVLQSGPPPPPPPSPPPPVRLTARTGAVTDIGPTVATIHGSVNPGGAATTVYVEYGKSGSYGSRSSAKTLTAGSADQAVTFELKKLNSKQQYHYRLVATHAGDPPATGDDATFTTEAMPNSTNLVSRTTTATPGGWVTVMLTCKGTVKPRCRGTILLDYFGTTAGRASFSIRPGKHPQRIKLRPAIWKRVKSKGRLRVDVTTTTPNGTGDPTIDARGLVILAPRPAKHPGTHK